MTASVIALLDAVSAFVGLHSILSHGFVRARLVARASEKGFTLAYSLIAAATLVWAVAAYRAAPAIPLWATPGWLAALALAAMLPTTLLFVIGLLTPSPTVVRSDTLLTSRAGGGVLAVTRHSFLWGVALWATMHMIADGDATSLVLFGGFLVLAVGGAFHIDARRRAKLGAPWMAYAARTSNIPFAAIIEGRAECPPLEATGGSGSRFSSMPARSGCTA